MSELSKTFDHIRDPEVWLPFEILCLSVLSWRTWWALLYLVPQHWFPPATSWQNVGGNGASKPWMWTRRSDPPRPRD